MARRLAARSVLLLVLSLAAPVGAEPPVEAPPPGGADVPAEAAARALAIERLLDVIVHDGAKRDAAIALLVKDDRDGDGIGPLTALLTEHKKDTPVLVAVIRGLGRDGLVRAAGAIAEQLGHREDAVRGHAAVSLEYIGSREKAVVAALREFVEREKDEAIANHGYRALGRCGVGEARARDVLLRQAGSAKSEYASYGACIGLAYLEGDAKAARGVEKLLQKIGVPGSRRAGGQNAVKRTLVSWTLASIGDPKSAPWIRSELMARLENVKAEWVPGMLAFWDVVARVCAGERELLPAIAEGVRATVTYVRNLDLERYGAETRGLMDIYRTGREGAGFTPLGDDLLVEPVR